MRRIPYPHPGEILDQEFLAPLNITRYRLSKAIGVPQTARVLDQAPGRPRRGERARSHRPAPCEDRAVHRDARLTEKQRAPPKRGPLTCWYTLRDSKPW
mgnify:CR=1 FL=1